MAQPFLASRAERRELFSVLAISSSIGAVVGLAVTGGAMRGVMQGAFSGFLVSLFIRTSGHALRRLGVSRWRFGTYVAVTALGTTAAISAGLATAALPWLLVESSPGPWRSYVVPFACAVAASLGFSAWFALDRLLGGDVLVGLLTGRYHRPRREERIFLFADLQGSTGLAERLGELRYHAFLNQLFSDLAEPVQRHAGTIYQYVGDEMVVTWPLERGVRDGNCLRCAHAIVVALEQGRAQFLREFGVVPRLRMALHSGPVVAGEIGDLRREIVYSGDTINTAARIESAAKEADRTIVVSRAVFESAPLPPGLSASPLGTQLLRGKGEVLELFAIDVLTPPTLDPVPTSVPGNAESTI